MKTMPQHKYFARIVKGKNVRYFYSRSEYNAYLHKSNFIKNGKKAISSGKKTFNNGKKAISSGKKTFNSGKKFFNVKTKNQKSNILQKSKNKLNTGKKLFDFKSKSNSRTSNKSKLFQRSKKALSSGASNVKSLFGIRSKSNGNKISSIKSSNMDTSKRINDVSIDKVRRSKGIMDKYQNRKIDGGSKMFGMLKSKLFGEKNSVDKKNSIDRNVSEDELKQHAKEVAKYQKNEPSFMKKIKEIVGISTKNIDQATVNPNYDWGDSKSGWDNNCFDCTTTYDLRRRGYDVTAVNNKNGRSYDTLDKYYKPGKGEKSVLERAYGNNKIKTADDVYSLQNWAIKNYPPGSRGNLMVQWRGGGGHSMAWERTKEGLVIRDCQTNQLFHSGKNEVVMNVLQYTNSAYFVRTDDLEIKKGVLKSTREYS